MGKRKTPALSYGEYVQPHPKRSEMLVLARQELMKASTRVFPQFLQKLSDCVYPTYSAIVSENPTLIGRRLDTYPREPTSEHEKICLLLRAWAHEFNAEVDWLLEEALATLSVWFCAPGAMNSLAWFSMPVIREICTGDDFEFTFPAWHPQTVTWACFNESIRRGLEKALRGYERDTRRKAEELGLVRARGRYSPDNLEWFVLYQFAGLTSREIADQWPSKQTVEDSTVLKGVKAAAKLLAWDCLREPGGARSRKIR